MKFLLPFVLAVVLIAVDGKVVPSSDVETQQTGTQPFQLPQYFNEAQTQITNWGNHIKEEIQKHISLPNENEVLNTLKEHSANFTTNIQGFINSMSEEFKSKTPELENIWNNFKTKMDDMVNKIATDTQTTEQVNQLRAKFDEGVQTLVNESQNAAKTISNNSEKVQEDIAKFTKQAVDIAVQASQNLSNQLQHAAHTAPSS